MIEWRLETRNIEDLSPHPKNPRYLTKDQKKHLESSLDEFGLIEKPIINQDNTIIGGHQRIKLLKEQNIHEVECWVPDNLLGEKQVDKLNIRLNKNHGSFDYDILANEWDLDDLIEYGFDEDELYKNPEPKKKKEKKAKFCPHCKEQIV